MYALVSLISIISLSTLVVRVGTVALTMTGLSKEAAKRTHDRQIDRERDIDPKRSLASLRE